MRERASASARWLTFVWALLPLAFALPAAPCFAWAAWRLRSRRLVLEAAGYLVVTVLWIELANEPGAVGNVGVVLGIAAAIVACARAFVVRGRLLGESPSGPVGEAPALDAAADAGWTPVFPAERLRAAGETWAAAVACNGRDRHRLTMPVAQAVGTGLTGLALIGLAVYLHAYNRGLAAGIALVLAPALIVMFDRWVDGPVLYYRSWGRLHRLPLTSVTAVAEKSQTRDAAVLLSAPSLRKPLRISLRSRGYVMSSGARDHLHGWLSAPHVHWTPQAELLFDDHGSAATLTTRRRHRLLALIITIVLPLAILGAGVWFAYRGDAAPTIAGAPGYHTFGGPHGKALPVGRPWGRPCRPIRFAVERHVSDTTYTQVAAVVREARRDGIDVTLESRSFIWSPSSLYYLAGQTPADTVRVGIFAHDGKPPRLSHGRLEHIRLDWDAKLDPDGRHEDLTVVDGVIWTQAVKGDPQALRRSIRQLIAMTQGIIDTTRTDSGIASDSDIDRFTPADIAAMKRMSGCPHS